MLRFVRSNMGDCSEYIGGVGGGPFNAVSVINAAFSSFVVDIKILKVVVKIDRASTEVSPQECCVGRKDSGHIKVTLTDQGDGYTGLPLVKMADDGLDRMRSLCSFILKWKIDVTNLF